MKMEGPCSRNAGSLWEWSMARRQPAGPGDLALVAVGTEFCLRERALKRVCLQSLLVRPERS